MIKYVLLIVLLIVWLIVLLIQESQIVMGFYQSW